jgi:hypothetical protein
VEYFKNLNLENHSLFNVIEGKIYKKWYFIIQVF